VEKGWSILFGAVLLASFGLFAVAPFVGWWLPRNIASYGDRVDYLFYVILFITAFFFVLTEVLLVWAMYRYAGRAGHKGSYSHGNRTLEMLWTLVPAAILLYIAIAQVSAWEEIKYQARAPRPDQVVQVYAHQWEWRMRYPTTDVQPKDQAAWAEQPHFDDLHLVNELHTWKGAKLKVYLKTHDVIHSLFLPNLRLKQDALPGKTIPLWLEATASNTEFDEATGTCSEPADTADHWEIACAELCGAGHFRMRGRLFVHKDQADYLKWRDYMYKRQQSTSADDTALPLAAGGGNK
jgi:cytochrome c oxidase subunit 2